MTFSAVLAQYSCFCHPNCQFQCSNDFMATYIALFLCLQCRIGSNKMTKKFLFRNIDSIQRYGIFSTPCQRAQNRPLHHQSPPLMTLQIWLHMAQRCDIWLLGVHRHVLMCRKKFGPFPAIDIFV